MTADFQMFPVGGKLAYTVDYSLELTGGATVASVSWSITPQSGSPLSPAITGQADNLAEAQSTIQLSGLTHGSRYVLQSIAVLSTGESIPKDIAVLGFDG